MSNGFVQLAVCARYKSGDIINEERNETNNVKSKMYRSWYFIEFDIAFKQIDIDLQIICFCQNRRGKDLGFILYLWIGLFDCISFYNTPTSSMCYVMPVLIKAINFINARGLNKRKFAQLLEEIQCQCSMALLRSSS